MFVTQNWANALSENCELVDSSQNQTSESKGNSGIPNANLHVREDVTTPGWLSIDCGASEPYVDDKGISWVPEDVYVTGGSTATVALDPAQPYAKGQALTTLRYFQTTEQGIATPSPQRRARAMLPDGSATMEATTPTRWSNTTCLSISLA